MCFKAPKAPAVAPSPNRSDVQSDVTSQRIKLKDQQGATGNIFTSALGDSTYGQNAQSPQKLATLGGAVRQ